MTAGTMIATDEPAVPDEEPAADRPHLWSVVVPASALALLLLGLLFFMANRSGAYAWTYDESLQNDYGKRALAWYLSAGRDRGFLDYPSYLQLPQHGPFAETVIAVVQRLTGEDWTTRGIVTGIFAVLGVLFVALCGLELGGWWVALLAATGLAFYPRYFGAMFNNSKDIPFAAAMTLVLYLALRLVRRWDEPGRAWVGASVAVGAAIGAAASMRVVALGWFVVLLLLAAGRWWRTRRFDRAARLVGRRKEALAAGLVGGTAWAAMCVLWPYVALEPVTNLIDSVRSMTAYPWDGIIPFDGQIYFGRALPFWYIPEWLVIGSPVHVIALAGLGIVLALNARELGGRIDARQSLCLLAFVVPVVLLIGLRSTLFNGLRHFIFVVPVLVLFGALALVRLGTWLSTPRVAGRAIAASGVLLALGGQGEALVSMARLHPYEYAYFSPLIGGFSGAVGRYELDYWGECDQRAAEWLAGHGDDLPLAHRPATVGGNAMGDQYMRYLPADRYLPAGSDRPPDVVIWSTRDRSEDPQPTYQIVHAEMIEGYPACVIEILPDTPGGH
jgi:hypothetical protein